MLIVLFPNTLIPTQVPWEKMVFATYYQCTQSCYSVFLQQWHQKFTKRLQFKIVHVLTKVLHHDLLLVHVLSYAMYYLKKYTLIILTICLSNGMFEVAQEKSCKKNCRILYEKCDKSLHIKTCFQMCTMNRRQM